MSKVCTNFQNQNLNSNTSEKEKKKVANDLHFRPYQLQSKCYALSFNFRFHLPSVRRFLHTKPPPSYALLKAYPVCQKLLLLLLLCPWAFCETAAKTYRAAS